jgi:hypothetical protein
MAKKKGRKSNWQFDSRPLKVENCPHTIGKLLMKATNLLQTSPQLEVCTHNYGLPKSWEPQFWKFRDSHLVVGHVAKHRVDYKGEGGGFPQVWAVVSLASLCLPMTHPCTKGVPIAH